MVIALLERSAPRRALKAGLGRLRRSLATRSNWSSSEFAVDRGVRGSARIASRSRSNRSARPCLLMDIAYPGPKPRERSVLELLRGTVGPPKLTRDLATALLSDESRHDDVLMITRQAVHQLG